MKVLKIFAILAFFLFQSGCSSVDFGSTRTKGVSAGGISNNLNSWNQHQKVKLLPHQLTPINYLEQHPEVRGLMVYHYLGTGKTYLALGYAERNPNKKVVLFVPRFLKGHWLKNMKSYGVTDPSRYQIVAHNEGEKIIGKDLSNTIVIVDESHKVFDKITSTDPSVVDKYSKVYLNLQRANKILSLSGTPIFGDNIDIAYQVNLVSGRELIPFNREEFKVNFMDINQNRSALVGYYAESQLAPLFGSIAGTMTGLTLISSSGYLVPIMSAGGYFLPGLVKWAMTVQDYPLRSFNVSKMGAVGSKYITYYDFENKNKAFYPSKKIHYMDTQYNDYQMDFLLRYADSQLSTNELVQLLKDEETNYGVGYVSLNSTSIQDQLKQKPSSGLQISNLLHRNKNKSGGITYPEKFKKALNLMLKTKGPVAVYSHFYYNGTLLFAKYLDSMGQGGKYAILHPDDSSDKYEKIIDSYNEGRIKFLLIHPEITEGISLLGTGQLHMLETPYNKSFEEQIIGRAVRYRSHMHLPKNERRVDVYVWKQVFSQYDIKHAFALRENWNRNFSEFNYYGERTLVDKNAPMKRSSPDEIAFQRMNELQNSLQELITLLKQYSIETSSGSKK